MPARSIRNLVLLAIALIGLPGAALGQDARWQAHTSLRSVLDVASDGTRIWAATSGGVFSHDPVSGENSRFTVVEGLHSVETRAIAADLVRGDVWIGYGDGVLDRLDPETGVITTFRDIERADQFSARGVNRIVPLGDSLLVATDFGVVVFDLVREEVRDAFTRLGTFSPAIPTFDVVVGTESGERRIWVGSEEGVARGTLDGRNLQDPGNWVTMNAGLPSGAEARSLERLGDRLYVGTGTDLYALSDASGFQPQFVSSSGVGSLQAEDGVLYGTGRFRLIVVDPNVGASSVPIDGYQDPTGSVIGAAGAFWVGDLLGGLLRMRAPVVGQASAEVEDVIEPAGPAEPQFVDMDFSPDGTLWAAASAASGSGFHRLAPDGTWTAFRSSTESSLQGRSRYTRISAAEDGTVWAGSEGSGVASVSEEGAVETYDASNSSLLPAAGTGDFVIVGGVDTDRSGRAWVTTRGSSRALHVRSASGDWTALPPYVGEGLQNSSTAYGRIFVDSFDQKWIIVRDEANFNSIRGLMVVDTGTRPTDGSDDEFRFFSDKGSAGQGLPGTTVTSVVEDRDGLIWIGTDGGIAYFINTGIVARDPSARAIWPPWADRSQGAFVLFGLQVNDLAIDPANRLWVATNEGAWLIESVELGYALAAHFTTSNSPLFSDNVVSVAVDERTGRVFFSTDRGLVSFAGDAIAASESADDLFIYPNPARDGQYDGSIVIEGLVDAADVRIATAAGSVMASFATRGGRAIWDGRDRNGRPVPSGMYLVIAVGRDGEGAQYGRVAIIR